MDTLNEIRIKLTDFGRQCLRKDHTPDFMALINKTAKDIVALCNASAAPTRWKPQHGESHIPPTLVVKPRRRHGSSCNGEALPSSLVTNCIDHLP